MPLTWTLSEEPHNGTPCCHWWQTLFVGEDDAGNDCVRFLQFLPADTDQPGRNADALNVLGTAPISNLAKDADAFEKELTDTYGDSLRVPIADEDILTNPGGAPSFDVSSSKMDVPPRGTVLVGIIDDAIGFANQRFRSEEHRSRFLYLWQQGQIIDQKGPSAVPFGKEYLEEDLNNALATGARENDIYASLGMTNPARRALLRYASHGSAVADAAAGAPMGKDVAGKPGNEVRLLGVNLPVDVVEDAAGTYLEFFAILGLMRIMDHVEALEDKASMIAGAPVSYPVVINFSFGLSSGAPDPGSLFPRQVDAIHDKRKAQGKAPMTFVVPAGNQRKARTLGKIKKIKANKIEDFLVRVPIHSASSTIFEITAEDGFSDLQADLIAPCMAGNDPAGLDLTPGQFCVLSHPADPDIPMAAIYRTRKKIMVMIAPTRPREDAHFVVAQPGHWRVKLRACAEVSGVRVQIRRGDSPGTQFYRGYQSKLIDRMIPDVDDPDNADAFIQEEGTLNTLASANNATIVRALRGLGSRPAEPAKYSGLEDPAHPVKGTFTAEVADEFPSQDGRRMTGVRSKSITRLSGTSIAAGLASRRIVANDKPKKASDGLV